MSEPIEKLQVYVEEDIPRFERTLLGVYLYHGAMAGVVDTALSVDNKGKPVADFSSPVHEALFRAIKSYHELTQYAFHSQPSLSTLKDRLAFVVQEDFLLTEDQLDPAMNDLLDICKGYVSATDFHQSVARKGLYFWLEERRLQHLLKQRQTLKWTTARFSDEWSQEQAHVRNLAGGAGEEKLWHSIQDCINVPIVEVFLKLPWPQVNDRMGGGLARGDATLIVGATGAGKTTVAAHIAGDMAINQNAKGIFISTEQKGPGILPRLVSNFGGVPYRDLTKHRSVQMALLPQNSRFQVDETLRKLNDNQFYFRDWAPGDNIHVGITAIVNHYRDKISLDGRLDFIVMDWLGGTLTHGSADAQEGRARMQQAGDEVAMLADSLDIVTIATAQANPAQALNKSAVGGTHLSECKTLHRYFENLIGISALSEGEVNADSQEIQARFTTDQKLNIDKCRFGPGGLIPVRREFEFQRLSPAFGR